MCEKSKDFHFLNTVDGTEIEANCNTYNCPECGKIKIARLRKYLYLSIRDWDKIRFWTFTLSKNIAPNEDEHRKIMGECWRRLLTYLRRNKSLRAYQREFSFIKVIELHKSGYLHYHVFVNVYLPWNIVNTVWESICQEQSGQTKHVAFCFVKGMINAKTCANYVCKYITKSIKTLPIYIRKWSKSSKQKIWPEKIKSGNWIMIRVGWSWSRIFDKIHSCVPPLLEFNKSNFTQNDDKITDRLINSVLIE